MLTATAPGGFQQHLLQAALVMSLIAGALSAAHSGVPQVAAATSPGILDHGNIAESHTDLHGPAAMPKVTPHKWRVRPQRRLQQETPSSNNTSPSQADNNTATTTTTPGATNDATSGRPLPACPFWATRVDGTPGQVDSGITQDTRDTAATRPLWATDLVGALMAANATNGSAPGAVREGDVDLVLLLLGARERLFAPLTAEEQEAVLSYLLAQSDLNLTSLDNATLNDNYLLTLEAAPPPKAHAAAFLADVEELWPQLEESAANATALEAWLGRARSLQPPPRQAQALLLMGALEPPRVVQVALGPLPSPTTWRQVPVGPTTCAASWWQRPMSTPEGVAVDALVLNAAATLAPLLEGVSGGFTLAADCSPRCLTYSFSAAFGAEGFADEGAAPAPPAAGSGGGAKPAAAGGNAANGSVQPALQLPGTSSPVVAYEATSGRRMLQQAAPAPPAAANTTNTSTQGAPPPPPADISTSCHWNSSTPPRPVSQQRLLWLYWYRALEGHHQHPLGVEMLLDVGSRNPSDWRVTQVWVADTMFGSLEEVLAAWNGTAAGAGANVTQRLRAYKPFLPEGAAAQYSTFQLRTDRPLRGSPGQVLGQPAGPQQYEPGGRRFVLEGWHLADWLGWSGVLGHTPGRGLSAWDLRFKGERLAWEVALQEAYAGYGGPDPVQATTSYQDTAWLMGAALKPLLPGVDCPLNAALLDLAATANGGQPLTTRNAVCVFEHSSGMPLLRHWSDGGGAATFYGGLPATTLVVRSISTVYNYDYIMDLVLHMDGALEVRVHTTGYIQAAAWSQRNHGTRWGHPVSPDVSGTIHDHLLHWKVDLDIGGGLRGAGGDNSVRLDEMKVEARTGLGFGSRPWYSKVVEEVVLDTEPQAALGWDGSSAAEPGQGRGPHHLNIIAERDTNRWGSPRGYRLQHISGIPQVLPPPPTFNATRGIDWSYYKVAVTQRKESEPTDASPLNQALPSAPVVTLSDLVTPGESIRHQDLVLWVTSGLMHFPGAEDAPVTPTTGTGMGFLLRPFNYFDENAAIDLADVVYLPGPVTLTNISTAQAAATAAAQVAAGNESALADMAAAWANPLAEQPFLEEAQTGGGCRATFSGAVPFQYFYGHEQVASESGDGAGSSSDANSTQT